MFVINGCGETHKVRDTSGESEVVGIGIEFVPFEIITQRSTPIREQFENIGRREVYLLLFIAVIHRQLRRVLIHIVCIIISILRQPPCAETVTDVLIKCCLHKSIQILLTLTPSPHIIDNSTRNTSG